MSSIVVSHSGNAPKRPQKLAIPDSILGSALIDPAVLPEKPSRLELDTDFKQAKLPAIPPINLDGMEQVQPIESIVRSNLRNIIEHLKFPARKKRFPKTKVLPTRVLTTALHYLLPDERLSFMRGVLSLGLFQPKLNTWINSNLFIMSKYLCVEQRAALVSEIIPFNRKYKTKLVSTLLRSNCTLEELNETISLVGKRNLLALSDPRVTEIVAVSTLASRMRERSFGKELTHRAEDQLVESRIADMQQELEKRLAILKAYTHFLGTNTYKEYDRRYRYNLDKLARLIGVASTKRERVNGFNCMVRKMNIEEYAHLLFTDSRSQDGSTMKDWVGSDFIKFKFLYDYPELEVTLLTTESLYEIKRVSELKNMVVADRDENRIDISDAAKGDKELTTSFDNIDSLKMVLLHEMVHCVIEARNGKGSYDPRRDIYVDGADLTLSWFDFLELSGWRIYDENRYEIEADGRSVVLDGRDVPIGKALKYQGEDRVFSYWGDDLFSHLHSSNFTRGFGEVVTAYEDYVESTVEFILLAKRLIETAPEKFVYNWQLWHPLNNNHNSSQALWAAKVKLAKQELSRQKKRNKKAKKKSAGDA